MPLKSGSTSVSRVLNLMCPLVGQVQTNKLINAHTIQLSFEKLKEQSKNINIHLDEQKQQQKLQ